ncbi:MAG: hypothetical protein XE08_0117 [Parcubacteria bacterium 32_520]|nr:MAG: hypothetical protein XE08_0117 [Parcubacteria bacterium 32_520]HBY57447.1 hypothetical protein [Candidatus Atribacteria bacterium]
MGKNKKYLEKHLGEQKPLMQNIADADEADSNANSADADQSDNNPFRHIETQKNADEEKKK